MRIKICGVATADDVELVSQLGADAVGLNFYPQSPRYVDPQTALTLVRAASPLMSIVGVFVLQPLRQCTALAYQLGLRAIQWYGPAEEVEDVAPFRLMPAFRVRDAVQLSEIAEFLKVCAGKGVSPGAILIDSWVEGQLGGTGHCAPWELLASYRSEVPWILAGGLTPDNVAQAIERVRPHGIDVASGVEWAPGRKDPEKLRRFIGTARETAARLGI